MNVVLRSLVRFECHVIPEKYQVMLFGFVGFMGMTVVWIVVWFVFFKAGGGALGDTDLVRVPVHHP